MKADSSTIRIINQKSLLEAIYENDGIYKTALATLLNLSKPSVSRNVADLISMGIVEEKGEGESTKNGGRKPTMLCFNKTYRYIASLELSLKQPVCAIGDLKYNLLSLRKIDVDREVCAEEKKRVIAEAFHEMLRELEIPISKLGIIAISQPGIIGDDNKVFYAETIHHPWTNIGLKEYLQAEFDTPVMLENDVTLAAIGEMTMGFDKQIQNLIYVSCGYGVGSGIIYNGQLFEGYNRAAGELGFFLTHDGKRLEEVVGMGGLLDHINDIMVKNGCKGNLSFEDVVEKSLANDELVNQGLKEVGRVLGQALYNCCVMMDIPTVIFGGDYIRLGSALLKSIEETMQQSHFPLRPTIQKSGLREAAGIFGSFVIAKDAILQNELGL
ncbi:MAG: ROK family transcriptional regulator [Defluviitaleaceae bacterium]|nr:ROK family transcriptional regulator [Defluviitaleaceae bacterium]